MKVLPIIIFFISVIGLFKIKLYVQELDMELRKIQNEIHIAQNDLNVLQAEWSYLNNPRRLADLAEKYLKNNTLILASQIRDINFLQDRNNTKEKEFLSVLR
jgi:cell division protein FtsL